jgi:hypothetical protein
MSATSAAAAIMSSRVRTSAASRMLAAAINFEPSTGSLQM